MDHIYLDYSATTPPDPRVLETMIAAFRDHFGNASSVHSFGRDARMLLEQSREQMARLIGAHPEEVYFTSGGTESDNHALKGLAHAAAKHGRTEIITSSVEHHAVLQPVESLCQSGFELKMVPVDGSGRVRVSDVQQAMSSRTALVSIMVANNETGTLNPLKEIGALARAAGVPFHTDAVQAVGKIPVDVNDLGVDVLSLSGHKFYGPKGIGAIYIRKGTEIGAFMEGGGQESNRRAGTQNVPLAAGLAKAAELALGSMKDDAERIRNLREFLHSSLATRFPSILFNEHASERLPHILNISFDASVDLLDGEALIIGMDLMGVAVTSGSACTSGSLEPSHVLVAMGRDERTAKATIRFSIGRMTTESELRFAVDALSEVVERVRKAGRTS